MEKFPKPSRIRRKLLAKGGADDETVVVYAIVATLCYPARAEEANAGGTFS